MSTAHAQAPAEKTHVMAEREAARRVRALALADFHHLTHTSREIDLPDAHGVERFRVPSSDRRRDYLVAHHLPSDSWWCNCAAGVHARPCGHFGASLAHHLQRQRMLDGEGVSLDAYFAQARATREWLRMAEARLSATSVRVVP